MTFNFNNIIDAYGGNTPLIKIYGSNDYLLWQKYKPTPEVPEVPVFSCNNNIVTITCSTPNAEIRYRDIHSPQWIKYTTPFKIIQTTQWIAYSTKNGVDSSYSEPFTAVYDPTIIIPDDPVIDYLLNVVTITCSTSGATIYYKINDGDWVNASNPVSFEIGSDITIEAYSILNDVRSLNIVSKYCEYIYDEYAITNEEKNTYLTLEFLEAGTVSFIKEPKYQIYGGSSGSMSSISSNMQSIYYRINNGSWITATPVVESTYKAIYTFSVSNGDVVEFYGSYKSYAYSSENSWCYHLNNNRTRCYVYGNVLSLLNDKRTWYDGCGLQYFFSKCYYMYNHPTKEMVIPDVSRNESFEHLYDGCTGLTRTAKMDTNYINKSDYTIDSRTGKKHALSGYSSMYKNCYSLTTTRFDIFAPEIGVECFSGMFYGCSSLSLAPKIYSTTGYSDGCNYMFANCTSLNIVKCYITTIYELNSGNTFIKTSSSYKVFNNWMSGASTTGTFYRPSNIEFNYSRGVSGIPNNWVIQDV